MTTTIDFATKIADRIAKAIYSWDYVDYCDHMHGGAITDYTLAKWNLFQSNWREWWSRLDSGNRERFIRILVRQL